MRTDIPPPKTFFLECVDALATWPNADGGLIDPFVLKETQYGTAYYAQCLAQAMQVSGDAVRSENVAQVLKASLRHFENKGSRTIAVLKTGFLIPKTFQEFMWPPICKTARILGDKLPRETHDLLSGLKIEEHVRKGPPTNWAAVWLLGEQIATKTFTRPSPVGLDAALEVFFSTRVEEEQGFYHEPGHPNSYDLFARLHLGGLLHEEYDGAYRERLLTLEREGALRSLAWQMSDGSLSSAHRSTGQSWTDSAQIALFARQLAPTCPIDWDEDQRGAFASAAQKAYRSLVRWRRPDGVLSPVQNTFSGYERLGYQGYTFDANYTPLALAFLGDALSVPDWQDVAVPTESETTVFFDADRQRAVVKSVGASVTVNAFPSAKFDYLGINDVCFGIGTRLNLSSAPGFDAHPVDPDRHHRYGIGVGTNLQGPVNQARCRVVDFAQEGSNSVRLRLQVQGEDLTLTERTSVQEAVVNIEFHTDKGNGFSHMYIPCPFDVGAGPVQVNPTECGFVLQFEGEKLAFEVEPAPATQTNVPLPLSNRRSSCSLWMIEWGRTVKNARLRISPTVS